MIKNLIFIIGFVIVCDCCLAETWKIVSLNWQPYSGEQLQNNGNSINKLRQLLKRKGIDLIVEFYPWKRAQRMARQPEYVGYFPAWPEEVSEGFIASKPIDSSELGVITSTEKVSKLVYGSIDSIFRNFSVGYIKTYVYPRSINDAIVKYPDHVDPTPHEMSLVKKISSGRIDVGLTDPAVSFFLAEQLGIKNLVAIEPVLEKKPLVLAFRKDSDNMMRLNLLNELLR